MTEVKSLIELWPIIKPYTLNFYNDRRGHILYPKITSLYNFANKIIIDNMPGNYVEAGVYRGGSAAAVGEVFKNTDRHIWLFDSWEGMPPPSEHDISIKGDKGKAEGGMTACDQSVAEDILFIKLGLSKDHIHLVKGWFEDTLKVNIDNIGDIAMLHIDCDWFESYNTVLDTLYDKVIPGGFIQLDDPGYWLGAQKATDAFFARRMINPEIIWLDKTGCYFVKP